MNKKKAKIRCVTYGGRFEWFLRKHFSKYTSWAYLEYQYFIRKKLFKKYIDFFDKSFEKGIVVLPCLISIETINRCNSTCSFCPANRFDDKRPLAKMDEQLFKKIIDELADLKYDGYLNLYVNNEPFMDSRIEEWYGYAKKMLPNARMLLYTNGTLLTVERFRKVIPNIDKMIINNYSENFSIHKNVQAIYDLVMNDSSYWEKDITIQIRYIKEILTNRAGEAPNKRTRKEKGRICVMPFTDFTIYPNGVVGICCSDALEKTNLGNINDNKLIDIWTSDGYKLLRDTIGVNRDSYHFCKGCDFVDAGIRNNFMINKLQKEEQ